MANWHMANCLIRQIDCGELAYGKKAYGETTYSHIVSALKRHFLKTDIWISQSNFELLWTLLTEVLFDENKLFFNRRVYSSRSFILPVLIWTVLYNIPKFFELYVKEEFTMTCFNSTSSYNITFNIKETHNDTDCGNGTLVNLHFKRGQRECENQSKHKQKCNLKYIWIWITTDFCLKIIKD